jgi:hypothetical protein
MLLEPFNGLWANIQDPPTRQHGVYFNCLAQGTGVKLVGNDNVYGEDQLARPFLEQDSGHL